MQDCIRVDAQGLRCPMPLLKTKLSLAQMAEGEVMEVLVSDPSSIQDIPAWLSRAGHTLISLDQLNEHTSLLQIKKGSQ